MEQVSDLMQVIGDPFARRNPLVDINLTARDYVS